MKRVNTFGKRAIALLLVVFMLVGQLPVGVVAEGPEGENPPAAVPETGKEFKLVVTRTAVPAPAAEGEEPAPGEGEGEGEGEEEQIPTYTYNAVVYYDGIQLTGDQLTESTHYWGTENVVPADDGASLTTEATEMKYTVQYRGRELSADIAQDGTVEKVWSASCGVISAVAGVPYDFSGVKPVADAENGSSVLTDGTWEFAADSSVIDANNIPTKAGEGLSAGQYLLKFEDTVEYVVPVTANISILTPADPTVAVSGEGYADGAWYTGAGPLTAAVTFNYSAKVESQYLPKLNLNGTPVEVTWAEPVQSEGEPAIFSYEGTYEMTKLTNAKHTLTFGDASCTVLVDNAAPSFVASGYKQGNGAVISVSNIESVSGIKEWTPADPVDGKILIENYDPEKGIVIGATAYNGLYYEVSPEIDDYVYANWSHTFTADDIVPTADGKVWLKKGVTGTVTVSLENPGDLISSGVQLSNGAVLNAENNYTQTVTITDDAEPITISGADKYGREILWAAAPVAYRYDKEAPVVNFVDTTAEPNVVGDVKYYNAPVEYKITISDNLEMGTASVQADGININGNNGVYTITVNNGEKLEKIEVAATDASGNTATETYEIKAVVDTDKPVVTIELSENIEKLLTVNEDVFAIVENTNGNEAIELTATVTVTDANLDVSKFDKTWDTTIAGKAVKTFEFSAASGVVSKWDFAFDAIDQALWTADAAVLMDVVEAVKAEANQSVSFSVDRRPSDVNITESLPTVTFDTSNAGNSIPSTTVPLFGKEVNIPFVVSEAAKDNGLNQSGISAVSYKIYVDDEVKTEVTVENVNLEEYAGVATYTVAADFETKNAKLEVNVVDRAGNTYQFVQPFACDNKAPVITVEKSEAVTTVNGMALYTAEMPAVVEVTVDFGVAPCETSTATYKLNGVEKTMNIEKGVVSFKDTIALKNHGEELSDLVIDVKDQMGNSATYNTFGNTMRLVKNGPVLKNADNRQVHAEIDEVDYCKDPVTFTFSFETDDFNPSGVSNAKAVVNYKLEGDSDFRTVKFTGKSAEFVIQPGQVLVEANAEVIDDAGNKATWTYNGNKIAVMNKEEPKVVIERTSAEDSHLVQTVDGTEYFNGEVTYKATVTGMYLNENVEETWLKKLGFDATVSVNTDLVSGEDTVVLTYTVKANTVLEKKAIGFAVKDVFGRSATIKSQPDKAARKTAVTPAPSLNFIDVEGEIIYDGNTVIVDTKAPVVSGELSAGKDFQVTKLYQQGDKIFAYIEKAESNFIGKWFESVVEPETDTVNVKLTLTTEEEHLDMVRMNALLESSDLWTDNVYTTSQTVSKDHTAVLVFSVPVIDMADNIPVADLVITAANATEGKSNESYPNSFAVSVNMNEAEDSTGASIYGVYGAAINLDRRTPGNGATDVAPVITIAPDDPVCSDPELYNVDFAYTLTVKDLSNEGNDSGVDYDNISVQLVDECATEDGGVTLSYNHSFNDEGETTLVFTVPENYETEALTLYIQVPDMVGNTFYYTRQINADTWNPRVSVNKDVVGDDNDSPKQTLDGVDYYKAPVTYTVTGEDLFLSEFEAQNNLNKGGSATAIGDGMDTLEYNFTVEHDEVLDEFTIMAKDLAEHYVNDETLVSNDVYTTFVNTAFLFDESQSFMAMNSNPVVVDMEAPVIDVTFDYGKDEKSTTEAGYDYYQNDVRVDIKVTDDFLTRGEVKNQTIKVTYKLEQDGVVQEKTVEFADMQAHFAVGKNVYSTSFTVTDGQVLSDLKVVATDNATNGNSYTYEENPIVVDYTPAEVKIVKTTDDKQVYDFEGNDYYGAPVTYTISVNDRFMDGDKFAGKLEVIYQNGEITTTEVKELREIVVKSEPTVLSDVNQFVYSFTAEDDKAIAGFKFYVMDDAGNYTVAEEVKIEETEKRTTLDDADDHYITYSGQPVIVDTVSPKMNIRLEGEGLIGYHCNSNGTLFVKLDPTNGGDAGLNILNNKKTVTLIATITDKNLTNHKSDFNVVTLNGGTIDDSAVKVNNDASSITYTKDVSVSAESMGLIEIELKVFDLAGNELKRNDISFESINNTTVDLDSQDHQHIKKTADGTYATTISVDRRRPTSGNDIEAPAITITTPAHTTSNNGRDLYNGAFNIGVSVNDGEKSDRNAGLNRIYWTITDSHTNAQIVKDVTEVESNIDYKNGTYAAEETIPVTLRSAEGESNDVKLVVVAVDNVGNSTRYEYEFAVDNLAPRTTVTYVDAVDDTYQPYFRGDRIARVEIKDINLNKESIARVDTQVDGSGFGYDGQIATGSYTYATDGEYTFFITTTDLANNTTDSAEGSAFGAHFQFVGAAPRQFVVDKTAPVINVTYTPSVPIGSDSEGVLYYDKDLGVNASIREVNFDASAVKAAMGDGYSLHFAAGGDLHTASTTYTDGNRYSFTINYTDKAGNPAVPYSSPTFSVDTKAPTIQITKGDMDTTKVYPVQNDLLLGFTINDAESNLKTYNVTVTKLDNSFKSTVVKGAEYYSESTTEDRTTVVVDFANIVKEKNNDGVYVVSVTAEDYSGHIVNHGDVVFSLNRFGSTFTTDDAYTKSFLTPADDGIVYTGELTNKLIFKEINPNRVYQDAEHKEEGSVLTIVANGKSVVLEKDVDYTLNVEEEGTGNAKWYVYTYEVNPDVFLSEDALVNGKFSILIYGEDEAGNKNTNEANEFGAIQLDHNGEYTGKIEFTIDTENPIITTTGIETGKKYTEPFRQMQIYLTDNTPTSISVKLNGEAVTYFEQMDTLSTDDMWLAYDEMNGCYVLNVPAQNDLFGYQSVEITAIDAAGNQGDAIVDDFLVTTSTFILILSSGWFYLAVGLTGLAALLLVFMKKKKAVKVK